MQLKVDNLNYSIDNVKIINNINLKVEDGSFVGLIGPNGSGKSTLLKNIYRLYRPDEGDILLNGVSIMNMKYKDSAKVISVLGQELSGAFDFSVKEIVFMGRSPHKTLFETDTNEDYSIVDDALKKVGMFEYRNRKFKTLSGGEKQRVLIARALAQKAKFLILDEPTNHLDIYYKMQIMSLVKSLNMTVFSAIHDLSLASFYCDILVVIKDGEIYDVGKTREVLTDEMVKEVFNVDALVKEDSNTGYLNISYVP